MEQPPENGRGRGGRGAMLLAALKSQARRPGAAPESSSDQGVSRGTPILPAQAEAATAEKPKPLGRGAQLQSLLQGRGRGLPSVLQETAAAPKIGRGLGAPIVSAGRGVALGFSRGVQQPRLPSTSSVEPDSSVQQEQISAATAELEKLSVKSYRGTSGKVLDLQVNYVRLKTLHGQGIYEYHVNFDPPVDSRNMRMKLLRQPLVKDIIGNVKVFDGSKLYLPVLLPEKETYISANMPTDHSDIVVCVKFVHKSSATDCIHLFCVLFKRIMLILKMTQVGRNYFDPKGGISVPQHHLEIWPGYVTAIHEFEGGLMLNCDASFRVLRSVTALSILREGAARPEQMKDAAEKNIVGSVVLTRYNNKTYRVDDIAWDLNPNSTFTTFKGQEISFKDYYKNQYDITIKDLRQPLLLNRPKKKEADSKENLICLIPELCNMTGLTDSMRNDFKVMKDIATHTRVTPGRRQHALQQFIDNVNSCPEAKQVLKDWNLELDSTPLSIQGRILDPEKIFVKKKDFIVSPEADWGRDIGQSEVLVAVNLEKWVVLCTQRDSAKASEFITMMKRVCQPMGIRVKEPIRCEIKNDRTETYCQALKEQVNPEVQIVVIIFPTSRDDRYSAIKKLCCIEMPVPSQVINVRTISQFQKLRSVTQKIALQMNCKLGGELWSLHIPMENIMVCGFDTYHDAAQRKQSVLGFVASINRCLTRWFSMTTLQKAGQELGDSLRMLFLSALRKYHEVNHKLPDKIFVYRDGVGDGQLDYVSKYEVDQFNSCFKHFEKDYNPFLSVIVVQKRINTRMYAVNGRDLNNPGPGSILDHTVTRRKWYDFFLVSQHVRQGTVSPTHYIVVCDKSNMKPEYMQRLAYKMTHLYYNWPGTVRVPAPCQYAHKLAYLVGQNLHKETHAALADKLFYL